MIDFFGHWLTTLVYQPFFNLLVYIYLLLDKASAGQPDMGWAVIIFTIVFRLIILPLSLKSDRSEKERREIGAKLAQIKNYYRDNPLRQKTETRLLLSQNKKVLGWEVLDLGIQILIMIMLYRIFTTGLQGTDLHLLYRFMPPLTEPFNLIFLGQFDLTHSNLSLNLLNTAIIFVAQFLSLRFSPFPMTREDKTMLAVLPLGALTFFAFMPAGKKLFIMTTLLFSISLILAKQTLCLYHGWSSGRSKLVS